MRTREQVVDEMLVLAAQSGEVGAFECLAERWHPRLLRHARRLTGDGEGARDAVQEAWIAIARGLLRLRDPACFGPWALRILSRRCAEWISRRQKARGRAAALEDAEALPAPEDVHALAVARLREALRRLEPERRALVAMFYVEGCTVAEIARALGVPAGTVKSRLYGARERLRALVEV